MVTFLRKMDEFSQNSQRAFNFKKKITDCAFFKVIKNLLYAMVEAFKKKTSLIP